MKSECIVELECRDCVFDVVVCKSYWSKFRGLMFSKPRNLMFDFGKVGVFSIHMFFVFFSIDLVYLDEDLKVVGVRRGLKPFTPYFKGWEARYLLELKDSKGILVEDKFSFVHSRNS